MDNESRAYLKTMKKIRFYKKTLAVPALLLFLTGCAGDDA